MGVVLVAVLVGVVAGCERRAPSPVSVEEMREELEPVQESWDVHYYISNDALPRVHIDAGHLAKYEASEDSVYVLLEEGYKAEDGRVVAFLFDTEGDSSAVLTADRLYYFENERRMEAQGAVQVVTKQGKRLESEHLVWDEATREVRTTGFVRITAPNERIQGYDLVADEDLETYRISRITGQVDVDEDA